jgi:hypothetical protein
VGLEKWGRANCVRKSLTLPFTLIIRDCEAAAATRRFVGVRKRRHFEMQARHGEADEGNFVIGAENTSRPRAE